MAVKAPNTVYIYSIWFARLLVKPPIVVLSFQSSIAWLGRLG
jgi:hypothetical protein